MKKKQNKITMKTTLDRSPFYREGLHIYLRGHLIVIWPKNELESQRALRAFNAGYDQALKDQAERSRLFCEHLGI